MWKYKYLREYLPDDELMGFLNALGEDGWSLLGAPVWVPPCTDDRGRESAGLWRCFFKRTVSNREQLKAVFALPPQEARP